MREIKKIKFEEIKPPKPNPIHSWWTSEIENAKECILNGFKVPIIVDENNVVLFGHRLWQASKELKLEEVPCLIIEDFMEQEKKLFKRLTDRIQQKYYIKITHWWEERLPFLEIKEILHSIDMEKLREKIR